MENEVVSLRSAQGSYLGTVSFFRMTDGEIRATLDQMPGPVIEAEETITARFFRVADWCARGALDFMRQGVRFDDETRETMENPHDQG